MFGKRHKEHCYEQGVVGGGVEMEGKLNICFSSSPPLNEMGSSPPHLIKLN